MICLQTPRRRKLFACSIAAALALAGVEAAAQADAVQLRLLSQFELPLRWDNVEPERPYWERGAVPTWRQEYGVHAIRLDAGQTVTVRIPAGETLRLRALENQLPPGVLSVSISNGTGLYLQQSLCPSTDGKDWLLDANDNGPQRVRLARIALTADATPGIDLAVFVSRREPLGIIAPYRRLISLPGPAQEVRRAVDAASQPYWPLAPQQTAEFALSGPARYAVRTRLHYPATETATAQNWHIETRLDGLPWAVLKFETGAESAQPVWVDGRETLVSREKESYLEIPPGRHRLSFSSSGPSLIRLLEQEDPDYLVPSLNEPKLPARDTRADIDRESVPGIGVAVSPAPTFAGRATLDTENPLLLRRSSRGKTVSDGAAIVAKRETSPIQVQAAAQRLYQDNRLRDSGMLAAAASLQAASRQQDMPALRREADEKARIHTFFRDLLPRNKPQAGSLRFAWFLTPSLNGIGEAERGTVIAGQHANQLLQSLDSGFFLSLASRVSAQVESTERSAVLAYELPKRFAPGTLRVAVHGVTDSQEKIYLQYDGQPPVVLSVASFPDLPGDRFAPSSSEAALRLMAERHGQYGIGTLSGAFSQRHTPAPLTPARVVDIPLPRQVERIQLWREGSNVPLWLALKLRAAKPYQMSERAYLQARRQFSDGPADESGAITAFMTSLAENPAIDSLSGQEIDSHWQPLVRLVRAQAKLFNVAVAPSGQRPVSSSPMATSIAEAIRLGDQGQWLPAFEAWSKVAASPLSEEREKAIYGQVDTLRQMGEDFLAEQLLKQEALQGRDRPARRKARTSLADIYRQADDQDALQALYAAALVRDPEADSGPVVSSLAEALLNNGEPSLALTAGLLLPRRQRPLETLLRAAYALEWWQVFEDLVAQLPDAERQHLWRAQRAVAEGQYDEAEADFQRGGKEGLSFAEHMNRARTISAALALDPNAQSLADWAQWNASHPGPRTWQDATHLVADFAGTESLYSIDRNIHFNVFRSEPGRPLRLRVAGPVKLRIEARPLHLATSIERIEGWLSIRTAGHQWQTPITQNAPTSGLAIIGRPDTLPGRRVMQELELGPGWHEVEADGDKLPLLLRVQVEQPELRLPLLPKLTADTASGHPLGVEASEVTVFRPWLGSCPDCSLLMDIRPGAPQRYLRLQRNLLDANPTSLAESPVLPMLPMLPSESVANEAALRAGGQWQTLLSWPVVRSDTALRERVISLLWIGEHHPEHYLAAIALAEAIRATHPRVAGLSALVDRLGRNSAWAPINIVSSSAGLRSREITGWDPEAPTLRVRRALLPPIDDNERILTGDNRLVAAFTNIRPTRISLTMTSADVAGLPPQPLTALLQIDNQVAQRIQLAPEHNQAQRTINLPSGRHSLRLWIDAPLANQFLRVRISEAGRTQFAETVERFYHVATLKEPVRVKLAGPAWIRIDEWIDGRSESSYHRIDKDSDDLILTPQSGHNEALYRIYQSTLATGRSLTQPRTLDPESTPAPAPAVIIEEPRLADPVKLADGFRLGGQEDGTWSLGLSRQERLYGRDSSPPPPGMGNSQVPVERFLEYSATHRYFDEDRHTHFRTDFLARQRQIGHPTLGVKGLASISPQWTFWNLSLDGGIFMQNAADSGSLAWAWNLGATAMQRRDITPRLWHEPKVSLFWRGGRVENSATYRTGQLDQDIFTPYRATHRHGAVVGDTLTWRPWLDAELYAGVHLTSNEDYNPVKPDNVANTLGWRQLIGPFQLRTQWDGNHYLADTQRTTAIKNSKLGVDLAWEHWLPNQERLEVGLSLKREIDARRTQLGVSLTWHFGNGRAYRDFRPAELDFSDLRQRRVHQEQNNHMSESR